MKLCIFLALIALAAAAPKVSLDNEIDLASASIPVNASREQRNQILVNVLVNQMIAYLRMIINNGSLIFGIPPLDPLLMDHVQISVPAGLINLNLEVEQGIAEGFGSFVTTTNRLQLSDLTFDLDLNFPLINITCQRYDLQGDLFNAIPLYGEGETKFVIENFRLSALLHLRQSDDGESILIDRVERPWFILPSIRSELTGVIGGGDIDKIVNSIVSEVVVDYVNRFQRTISNLGANLLVKGLNPVLNQLDTWKYISRWV